jgi:hypothetical protein
LLRHKCKRIRRSSTELSDKTLRKFEIGDLAS